MKKLIINICKTIINKLDKENKLEFKYNNKRLGFGTIICNAKGENITHNLTNLNFNNLGTLKLVIQKGLNVKQFEITSQHAEQIGFINLEALHKYCK